MDLPLREFAFAPLSFPAGADITVSLGTGFMYSLIMKAAATVRRKNTTRRCILLHLATIYG